MTSSSHSETNRILTITMRKIANAIATRTTQSLVRDLTASRGWAKFTHQLRLWNSLRQRTHHTWILTTNGAGTRLRAFSRRSIVFSTRISTASSRGLSQPCGISKAHAHCISVRINTTVGHSSTPLVSLIRPSFDVSTGAKKDWFRNFPSRGHPLFYIPDPLFFKIFFLGSVM